MNALQRNFWVVAGLVLALSLAAVSAADGADEKPNFVIIFADDLGYGDLSCYGHPTLMTPNLDQLAREGLRFTQFYSAAPVCTPSRAALMTGRYAIRSGLCQGPPGVLFPYSASGIPHSELTLAEGLKSQGYATACIGKWHLGHLPEFLPTSHGFDYYFGIPYSNDMKPTPLMRNTEVIEEPADQTTLTKRYAQEAVKFIREHHGEPFLLYFPHTFPHVPLYRSREFEGTSRRGEYGDVVEELDWSVGEVMKTLHELELDENTLVLFTSDNGPWLIMNERGGSAGLLKEGKGSTWEGGMREPGIAWWPGKIDAGRVTAEMASTMDIYTTCMKLAGADIPTDRIVDGVDMSPILFGQGPGKRETMFYYRGGELRAVRKGIWKAHVVTMTGYRGNRQEHDPPLLFNLEVDPSEQYNLNEKHPDIVKELVQLIKDHKARVKPVESRLKPRLPEK